MKIDILFLSSCDLEDFIHSLIKLLGICHVIPGSMPVSGNRKMPKQRFQSLGAPTKIDFQREAEALLF